jgi:hypothetical protein
VPFAKKSFCFLFYKCNHANNGKQYVFAALHFRCSAGYYLQTKINGRAVPRKNNGNIKLQQPTLISMAALILNCCPQGKMQPL